jgi:hypothetical protein
LGNTVYIGDCRLSFFRKRAGIIPHILSVFLKLISKRNGVENGTLADALPFLKIRLGEGFSIIRGATPKQP